MTAKLRQIHTVPRATTLKRRDVAAAVKEVMAMRDAKTTRLLKQSPKNARDHSRD